jgi:hypothetical protein
MWRSVVLGLLTVLTVGACSSQPRRVRVAMPDELPCAVSHNCTSVPADGIDLSEGEQCWLSLVATRCSAIDKCIADCLVLGEGRDVGGGCFHICGNVFSLTDQGTVHCIWDDPDGWDRCSDVAENQVRE